MLCMISHNRNRLNEIHDKREMVLKETLIKENNKSILQLDSIHE